NVCQHDPVDGSCPDEGNACTDDVCSGGQCTHPFAPRCLTPILSLLEEGQCGDGVLDPGEECDDGNVQSGDGCSATCRPEVCFACAGEPSSCSPITLCTDG